MSPESDRSARRGIIVSVASAILDSLREGMARWMTGMRMLRKLAIRGEVFSSTNECDSFRKEGLSLGC